MAADGVGGFDGFDGFDVAAGSAAIAGRAPTASTAHSRGWESRIMEFYLRYNPGVMRSPMLSSAFVALLVTTFLGTPDANAVRLDPEAGGQALIYPYYTARSYGTDPFNTYLSIVNTSADGKALRVRFREGKEGLETLGFNLFLSPNDTWTGALVPSADGGTQLITTDRSCATYASPFDAAGVNRSAFSASSFAQDGLDRTREGYVEVFEMGTVKGATLAAITQDASGLPHDCSAVQSRPVDTADIAAPSGGLHGTLTLIDVTSGMDMTVNAEALADLAQRPYYRAALDPYPDWKAAEIDPVSYVRTSTHAYRLIWSNALQAVSSVLMRPVVSNEYIIDAAVAASTDWVVTFPTRRLQVTAGGTSAPFQAQATCEILQNSVFNREAQQVSSGSCADMGCPSPPPLAACAATNIVSWERTFNAYQPLFGSKIRLSGANGDNGSVYVGNGFQNGAIRMRFAGAGAVAGLLSQPGSMRFEMATARFETGAFRVQGLPAIGFMARSMVNGTLSCGATLCQGNYGSAFSHHGAPIVVLAP